jgi:hypothetical protein
MKSRIHGPISLRFLAIAFFLASAASSQAVAQDAATRPPVDETAKCMDGGQPFRIGSHLCTSEHIVSICLRANQSYGVRGVYGYAGHDKGGLHFDKAHWVATTSERCRKGDRGRVYY